MIKVKILVYIALLIACFSLGMNIGNLVAQKSTRYIIQMSESDTELFFETLDEMISNQKVNK